MRRTVVACVGLILLLTGCSSSPTTPERPTGRALDAIFLDAVKADAPALDDAALVRVAHVICEQYAKDPSPSVTTWMAEIDALTANGFTAHQAGTMTGAATGAYCPQYSKYAPKP